MKAALIFLAALPLFAITDHNEQFCGRVTGGNNANEVASAIITVTEPHGYIDSVVTNSEGEFCFSSLPPGEYNIRVTAHAYAIYERQISVSPTVHISKLNIHLLVPADSQTVSVSQLRNANITSRQSGPPQAQMNRGF